MPCVRVPSAAQRAATATEEAARAARIEDDHLDRCAQMNRIRRRRQQERQRLEHDAQIAGLFPEEE